MILNNQLLSNSAAGSADLKLSQRYLPKIRTEVGSKALATNSFAENIKSIKTKIAAQDVFSKTTSPMFPNIVKCEWPSQPRTILALNVHQLQGGAMVRN